MLYSGIITAKPTSFHPPAMHYANVKRVVNVNIDQTLKDVRLKYPSIRADCMMLGDTQWVIFNGPFTCSNPFQLPAPNPRVIIEKAQTTLKCHLEVHFKRIESFDLEGNEDQLFKLIESLLPNSGYCLCLGLPQELQDQLSFESKSLRKWGPFMKRMDRIECLMWFKPQNERKQDKPSMCSKCFRLNYHLRDMLIKKSSVSPSTREKRTASNSRYPSKFLTPTSKARKAVNLKKQSRRLKQVEKKLRMLDLNVSTATNDELVRLVSQIEGTSKKGLEEILAEADATGATLCMSVCPLSTTFISCAERQQADIK